MTTDQYVEVSTEDPGKKVFADIMSEVMNSLIKDAYRYRWLRSVSGRIASEWTEEAIDRAMFDDFRDDLTGGAA